MCGRYAVTAGEAELAAEFAIDEVAGPLPPISYNIAPTDPVVAILERDQDRAVRRLATTVRWGLVPSWAKDAGGAARLINARVETVAEKPSFRRAFARRRCLLPAAGYYEWVTGRDSSGRAYKQPYFIRPADGGMLAMAGIYEFWRPPTQGNTAADWLVTAAIITGAATDHLGRLHDRMPLRVDRNDWEAWLDPGFCEDASGLLSVPVQDLVFEPVSTAVNRVGVNSPELIVPIPDGE